MPKDHASCITCHSSSVIKNDGTDGSTLSNGLGSSPIGPEFAVPTDWIARDFSWGLALACPNEGGGGAFQACATSAAKAKPVKKKM